MGPTEPNPSNEVTPTPTPDSTQAQAVHETQPGAVTPPSTKKKKTKKGLIVGGIAAGLLGIFIASTALAYNVWYQNPDKVIFDAVANVFKAESMTSNGVLAIETDDVDLKVSFDSENALTDSKVQAEIEFVNKSDDEELSFDVTASLLIKGDTWYFKLDNVRQAIDDLAETYQIDTEGFDPVIDKIDGQWVSVKPSDYEDVSSRTASQQSCIAKVTEEISSNKAMQQELVALYKQHPILVIDERLPVKRINDVASLGYKVSTNGSAAEEFAKGLADTEFGKAYKDCDDEIDFDEIAEDIKDNYESNDDFEGRVELWVSRFKHQFTEIKITGSDSDTKASLVLNPIFGQNVTIEAPSNAITFKQLQEDIEKAIEDYYISSFDYDLDDYYYDEDADSSLYNLN